MPPGTHLDVEGIVWLAQCEADFTDRRGWLTAVEKRRAGSMRYTKRRMDYLLGRWTAKSALARAASLPAGPQSFARIEVGNASDGSPRAFVDQAPASCQISMTDRAGWAVCSLAPGAIGLGCDLELVEPRSELFISDYLTEAEQCAVRSATPGAGRDLLANLMWSAKESALKVLRTGLRRDTRSVVITLDSNAAESNWCSFSVECDAGPEIYGWWKRFGAFLLTVASTARLAPPMCLAGDARLSSGQPSHSWLARPLAHDELG